MQSAVRTKGKNRNCFRDPDATDLQLVKSVDFVAAAAGNPLKAKRFTAADLVYLTMASHLPLQKAMVSTRLKLNALK